MRMKDQLKRAEIEARQASNRGCQWPEREDLQRRFERLAKKGFGFSVAVDLSGADPALLARMKRLGQRAEKKRRALALLILES